jgi:hypothetical protein
MLVTPWPTATSMSYDGSTPRPRSRAGGATRQRASREGTAPTRHVLGSSSTEVGFRPVGVLRDYERDTDGRGWHDGLLMDLLAAEAGSPGAAWEAERIDP